MSKQYYKNAIGLIILLLSFSAYGGASISKLQLSLNKNTTKFVFELSEKPKIHTFGLSKPARWVIDLKNTKISGQLPKLALEKTIINHLRISPRNGNDLRLVFDLKRSIAGKIRILPRKGTNDYELSVTFPSEKHTASAHQTKWELIRQKTQAKVRKSQALTPSNIPLRTQARDVIVVVDPGHGGRDPGAIGPRGTKEKHIVLSIARRLRDAINKTPGMHARLTRGADYYISLRERLHRARKYKADVFVAIHADAYRNHHAYGSSVYTLSQRGASSEAARWLAEKENYSELGGVNLEDKSNLLRSVLIDLSQTATVGASLKLGGAILHALRGIGHLHKHRVEQAPFVVLKSPDIPSILVETGFISNRREERRLSSVKYQEQVVAAILSGLRSYFLSHAPPGSLYSIKQQAQHYVVRKGETLSTIAKQFGVSMKVLSRFNGLRYFARLHQGQVIIIPPQEGSEPIE